MTLRAPATIIAGAVLLAGCLQRDSNSRLFAIEQALATSPAGADLARAVPGDWDRLCIVLPLTPPDQIEASMGAGWEAAERMEISTDSTTTLLLFVRGTEVVDAVRYPRAKAEFVLPRGAVECTSRDDAVFEMRMPIHGGAAWVQRVPRTAPDTTTTP